MSKLFELLDKKRVSIEKALDLYLKNCFENHDGVLYKAVEHALKAPGKKLRPVLLLHASELCGGADEHAMYAAVAMEFIHTYSLIHDDLPAMDDASTRRGQPTVHLLFDDGMAVLAGDALLTEAFSILAKGPEKRELYVDKYLQVAQNIALGAGVRGMVRGQELDLVNEGKKVDLDTLKEIHLKKTAAMFKASLASGAILGGGNEDQIQRLSDYGELLGLAFQIRDDLLDIEGDPELVGKDHGLDAEHEKATYPALLGLEKSKLELTRLTDEAKAKLDIFEDPSFLIELADYLHKRDH